ncbi:MAG: hypothetical protein ACTHKH_05870 [Trinickia sp.]
MSTTFQYFLFIGNSDLEVSDLGKKSRSALLDGRYNLKHFVTASLSQFAHNAPQRFQHGCAAAWAVSDCSKA